MARVAENSKPSAVETTPNESFAVEPAKSISDEVAFLDDRAAPGTRSVRVYGPTASSARGLEASFLEILVCLSLAFSVTSQVEAVMGSRLAEGVALGAGEAEAVGEEDAVALGVGDAAGDELLPLVGRLLWEADGLALDLAVPPVLVMPAVRVEEGDAV